jgi:hypothetical protein
MTERPRGVRLCSNPDGEKTVEEAFKMIRDMSLRLPEKK